jgi:transposase
VEKMTLEMVKDEQRVARARLRHVVDALHRDLRRHARAYGAGVCPALDLDRGTQTKANNRLLATLRFGELNRKVGLDLTLGRTCLDADESFSSRRCAKCRVGWIKAQRSRYFERLLVWVKLRDGQDSSLNTFFFFFFVVLGRYLRCSNRGCRAALHRDGNAAENVLQRAVALTYKAPITPPSGRAVLQGPS